MDKDFYTVVEVADKLNCGERTVRELISKGELQAIKKLRKWYILHDALMAYLLDKKVA